MAPSTSRKVGVVKANENTRGHRASRSQLQPTAQSDPGPAAYMSYIPRANGVPKVYNEIHGTPMKSSSHRIQPLTTAAKTKPSIASELSDRTFSTSTAHSTMYSSISDVPKLKDFLAKCELYDSATSEWTELKKAANILAQSTSEDEDYVPAVPAAKNNNNFKEKVLYDPFMDIIRAIFKYFDGTDAPRRRWIIDTHKTPMKHVEDGVHCIQIKPDGAERNIVIKTSPDLSILGEGSYLPRTADTGPGYDHCLSPVEIKPDDRLNMGEVTIQVGAYARQCFIRQPHRRYVPTVVLTETRLYLFVYDRSGVLHSEEVDIHTDAASFVHILLGISSVDENLKNSPFDTRVVWNAGKDFPTIKVKLSLQIDSPDVQFEVYQVTELFFRHRTICGRGTVCWEAFIMRDGQPVKVLIKDSWRSVGRPAEWELLDKIKDLKGVGQILSYEEDLHCTISAFRGFIFKDVYKKKPYEFDRIFSRLVLKAYGPSIKHFRTKMQLLEAFRNAVAGHRNLWTKGVLHRDVSVENVLLGMEGAEEGNCGLLIDFDMAIRVDRSTNLSDQFRMVRTRAFQSYAVLKSADWNKFAPPQDHLDDLELFFYVLGWVCHKYNGTEKSLSPSFLNDWECDDPNQCAKSKLGFLSSPLLNIPAYFETTIFTELLWDLGQLCITYRKDKVHAVNRKRDSPGLADVYEEDKDRKEHDRFLKIIDMAIKAQRGEGEPEPSAISNAEPPVTPTRSEFVDPPETSQTNVITAVCKGEKRQTASSTNDSQGRGSSNKRTKQS